MINNNFCNSKYKALPYKLSYCFLFLGGLMSDKVHAQFKNEGQAVVINGTIVSIYEDYLNDPSGKFINDGQVYVFKNWKNDGQVTFTAAQSNGYTFFQGGVKQLIEGSQQSDFQNVVFNNNAEDVPFDLKTTISINNYAKFENGIINAADYNGLVIFNENASHQNVRDQSFVDGKVQKKGDKSFQFPVGSGKYFRPSFHDALSDYNVYTTQYFNKNSDAEGRLHSIKEVSIVKINDQEYWQVTKDQGAENVVLSLTLDHDTTPAEFFTETSTTQLAIVRWDETLKIWVNEGGVLSETISGEPYSNLLTGKVRGYGIFTMALVIKDQQDDDLKIYNAVSPNDDGLNDTFLIEGINKYPDNTVEIYNRWGVRVYNASGYNESNVMFSGYSDGRVTIDRGQKLPTGTYFYILKYNNGKEVKEKTGYLYINNQ